MGSGGMEIWSSFNNQPCSSKKNSMNVLLLSLILYSVSVISLQLYQIEHLQEVEVVY